jgi:hypothetical protein
LEQTDKSFIPDVLFPDAVPITTKEHDCGIVPQWGLNDLFFGDNTTQNVNVLLQSFTELLSKSVDVPCDVRDTLAHISKFTSDMVPTFNNMNEILNKVSHVLDHSAADHLGTLFDDLSSKGVFDSAKKVSVFLLFLTSVIYYCNAPTRISFGIMILMFAILLFIEKEYVFKFVQFCGSCIPMFDWVTAVPQSGFQLSDMAEAITLLLFTLNVKNYSLKSLPKNILDHLKGLKSMKDSLKDILAFFVKLLEMVLDYNNLGTLPAWIKYMSIDDPDVKELYQDCDELRRKNENNDLSLTLTNGLEIQSLHHRITCMLRTLSFNSHTAPIVSSLKNEQHNIAKILEVFRAAKLTDDGKRVEPTFAVFAGAPGNFKSQMMDFLCCELQKRTLSPEKFAESQKEHFRYVFKRDQANVYWDGYRDPHIVIFDDLGQFKTCVQNIDNEFSDIMKIVNELPLQMHMAAVDAKGNTYFKSRFILATTNFTRQEMENVRSREAFDRRVSAAFYMIPKEEYSTPETLNGDLLSRKLNKNHPDLPRGPLGQILVHPDYHSEFIRYDPAHPDVHIGTYTFDQVVDILVADYKLKDDFFNQKMSELDEAYQEPIVYRKCVKPKIKSKMVFKHRLCTDVSGPSLLPRELLDVFVPQMGASVPSSKNEAPVQEQPPAILTPRDILTLLRQHIINVELDIDTSGDILEVEDAVTGEIYEMSRPEYMFLVTLGMLEPIAVPQMGEEDLFMDAIDEVPDDRLILDYKSNDVLLDFESLCAMNEPDTSPRVSNYLLEAWMLPIVQAFERDVEPYRSKLYCLRMLLQNIKAQCKEDDLSLFARLLVATKHDVFPYFSVNKTVDEFYQFLVKNPEHIAAVASASVKVHVSTESVGNMADVWKNAFVKYKASLYTSAYPVFQEALSMLKSYSPYIALVVGILSAAFLTTKVFSRSEEGDSGPHMPCPVEISNEDLFPLEPQSKDDHMKDARPRKARDKNRRVDITHDTRDVNIGRSYVGGRPEMGNDEDRGAYELGRKICASNLVQIEYCWDDTRERIGHGLIIADRMMLVPRHFSVLGKARAKRVGYEGACIRLSFRSSSPDHLIETFVSSEYFFDDTKWVFTPNLSRLDQAFFTLPPDSARTYRSILKNIAPRAYHYSLRAKTGFLMGFEDHRDTQAIFDVFPKRNRPVNHPDSGYYEISSCYTYKSSTDYGDCGTPLYVQDRSEPIAKIIGMHVAGTTSSPRIGIAAALVREYLEEALAAVPQMYQIDTVDDHIDLYEPMTLFNNKFRLAHTSIHTQNDPPSSKIVKSPLFDAWGPHTTIPAYLRYANIGGEKISVKAKAYDKVAVGTWNLSSDLVHNIAMTYYEDLKSTAVCSVDKRVYSFEEAVCGLPDDPDYGSISRNTSPGYPYVFDPAVRRIPGKRYWLGIGEEYDLSRPQAKVLKNVCEGIIEKARVGVRSEHIFIDFLKDERRPIEKVLAGKTRMVNAGPLNYLIIVRMYFGAFCNWFTKNRILNGSAIGVNPYSAEWHVIATQLESFGRNMKNVGAGDYSAYDGSEKPVVHHAILEVINKWYDDGEENALIREVLWAELVQGRHLTSNIIYTAVMSLPSGHPLTALVNTMYNAIAFRYCWYRANDDDISSLSRFLENIYTIMLGDDNVYSVAEGWIDKFNDLNLEKWMKEFGLTYTNELKTVSVGELRHITEVSFLKRCFRFDDSCSRYVAPLEMSVILEMPYWTKRDQAIPITESNVQTSIMELALHGREIYDMWSKRIVDACDKEFIKARADPYDIQFANTAGEKWFF